jgi:hypothetical protein
MPPRKLKPSRIARLPDWLENRSIMHRPADCFDPETAWGACQQETVDWLQAHGLGAEDYESLCAAYERLRAEGQPPERALQLTLKRL